MAGFWMCHLSPCHIMPTCCTASLIYGCSTQDALMILKIGIMVSYMKLHPAPGNGERMCPSWGLSLFPYLLCLRTSMFRSLQRMGEQKYVISIDLTMSGFHFQLLDIAQSLLLDSHLLVKPRSVETLLCMQLSSHFSTFSSEQKAA